MRAFAEAGVRILVGTDGGFTYLIAGFSIHDELEMWAEAGVSPAVPLEAATRKAAAFLGLEGEFGRIAPGLSADLLLLGADPLTDVEHVRDRVGVMVRGEWLSEAELERRLDALAEELRTGRVAASVSGGDPRLDVPFDRH